MSDDRLVGDAGKLAIFREDGAKFLVRILKDESDDKWKRYDLKIMKVYHQAWHGGKGEVGEEFSVDHLRTCGAYGGMWTLATDGPDGPQEEA
jgi:hypothetical protein